MLIFLLVAAKCLAWKAVFEVTHIIPSTMSNSVQSEPTFANRTKCSKNREYVLKRLRVT